MRTAFTDSIDERDMLPAWGDDFIPRCDERCPSHDGNRCELLGFRPGELCEPALAVVCARAAASHTDSSKRGG